MKLFFQSLLSNLRCLNSKLPFFSIKKLTTPKTPLLISVGFFGFFKIKPEIPDITTALQLGHYYTLNSRFDEAESSYHTALNFIKPTQELQNDEIRAQNIALIHVYYSLAQLYLIIEQFPEAERLILDCMRLCLQLGLESTDNAIVELSLLLSRLYSQQNKLELSEKGLEFCLETQNDKVGDGRADHDGLALLGMTLYDYAHYCLLKGDLSRAYEFYERALAIARGLFEVNHPQICTLLNDMSTICVLTGQFERAENLLRDAMKAAEEADYAYVHRLYYNWAVVLSRTGKRPESRRWFEKAKRMAKDCGDEEFLTGTKALPIFS